MKSYTTVLAIELSTSRGKLAVVRDHEVLFQSEFTSQRSHNSQLFAPLHSALTIAGDDLDLIVIGLGPGSYTGVRIAIAAGQGIGMTRGIPTLGLPSIVAPDNANSNGSFCLIGDARRDGFFVATICDNRVTNEGIQVCSASELQVWLSKRQNFPVYTYDLKMVEISHAVLTYPSAIELAKLAQLTENGQSDLDLEPIYLRDAFITEAKRPWAKI
jgi:tRNA threonylcarbamoyladenosine biosynthesis protein TsaB